MTKAEHNSLIAQARDSCGRKGLDQCLRENKTDIIIGPGDGNLVFIPGSARYPSATLPLGYLDFNGRPFGLQMAASSHGESDLIRAMSAWEKTFPVRSAPDLEALIG
jgi:amidase